MKLIVDCAQKLQQLGERVFNEKKQETYEPIDEPTIATNFTKEHGIPCPDGYIFKDENGNVINAQKIVLEKKKKEYPKTYEECRNLMRVLSWNCLWASKEEDEDITEYAEQTEDLIDAFIRLKICRDAYWKIAGEEMGLGKPWEPDWTNHEFKYCIKVLGNTLESVSEMNIQCILAFPTEEMRDAFKENFDPDIEFCKELL